MENNYEAQINDIKSSLDKARNLRIKAETRLEQLEKQKQDILADIKAMGINPDEIEKEIERLEKEIREMIIKAKEMIPDEVLKRS